MCDDDKNQSLLQLSRHHGASIITQLVDIGSECNQQKHLKARAFIRSLQCLEPINLELCRRSINAFSERRYVALSYTWIPSKDEDPSRPDVGWYPVETWDKKGIERSSVRKCVLNRALRYMSHFDVGFLWIDAHCIRQDTCSVDGCVRHYSCVEKHKSLKAMDLVYQLSEHPVALLGRPLKSEFELHLLARVLEGDFFAGDSEPRLSTNDIVMTRKALSLLSEITQDSWWWRAWTFQENYRGGKRMRLLICHDRSLELQKRRYPVFGEIPEELCISSVTFSTETTRLCLALRAVTWLAPSDIERIEFVIRAAGRYSLTVRSSDSMTPTVIADVEARGLSKPWDRLEIVANCCRYPVRLDGKVLSQQRCSPSLSVLAMSLLNGEILKNDDHGIASVSGLTASEFLNSMMFRDFKAPGEDTRPLTFNKGCRLINVRLTTDGIATSGHIWRLGRIIDTAKFSRVLPWIDEPQGRLKLLQRKSLLQLVRHLHRIRHHQLANRIDDYLAADSRAGESFSGFTDLFLYRMAMELAEAILARQKLRLGSIWNQGTSAPYRAIFMWPEKERDAPPAFVFTSVRQGNLGSYLYDAHDIDCHVSLVVEIERSFGGSGVQWLRVQNWLLGMYFFDDCPRTRVVFPWPESLRAVRP
ncbi:uncharacterized protein PpBr36_10400 [Pyricularia pennisetigena]|uniref:uncharacterized protein n=1 Tax=Pyricularia pennisetigena TaxID=1578925 RepID=UPI0011515B5A|nr:uncharacterized protein PpBr36_10400 [Pyricularia pennisetigena]TLS21315.1 hypothetical protein PpBr36_10400 [Pyricularia pennisetigena]